MKTQPIYKVGDSVLYNSVSTAGFAKGEIIEVDNSSDIHKYTVVPDVFEGAKKDVIEEQHIQQKL